MGVGDIQDRPGWAQTGWGEQAATQSVVQQDSPEDGGSLRDLIRRRREELSQDRTEVLALPGYHDLVSARYEVVPYQAVRRIYGRTEKITDEGERELAVAAGVLAHSCVELLEKRQNGAWQSAGKWSAATVNNVFGADLPDGSSVREAIGAALGDWGLMAHFQEHQEKLGLLQAEVDEEMAGESEAASEAA